MYTQTQLSSTLNRGIQGKLGMLVDAQETMNDGVRMVLGSIDLRSARRKSSLAPNLFSQEFDYACPTDLKANGIIDIPQQAKRDDGEFNLIPSREFATNRRLGDIAIDDYNGQRILKINSRVSDKTLLISDLDSTTSGGGTWTAIGDATSLEADTDDYIKGNGSLKFSISNGGLTTAGIQNTSIDSVDLTDYLGGNGAIFVQAKINSTVGLTSYTIKIGSSSSDYYSKTVTSQNDGTAFVTGWNLLRFDLTSLTTTGTPINTTCDFVSLYMTKLGTKIDESDYKFDYMVLKVGQNADVKYYSNYGWKSSAGAYKVDSTDSSDIVVADTDEYNLISKACIIIAAKELDFDLEKIKTLEIDYDKMAGKYQRENPSESMIMTSEYYRYE